MTASDHGLAYQTAVSVVVAAASNWAENAEQNFVRRVPAMADHSEIAAIAEASNVPVEDVQAVAEVWTAVNIINGNSV